MPGPGGWGPGSHLRMGPGHMRWASLRLLGKNSVKFAEGLTNQGFDFDLFQGAPTIWTEASKKPTDARSFPPWHEEDFFPDDFYYVSNSIIIGHS